MRLAGSCHCGRIAYEVEVGDGITEVYDCNCSMCRRRGGLLWFAPRSALVLQTAEADLATGGQAARALRKITPELHQRYLRDSSARVAMKSAPIVKVT